MTDFFISYTHKDKDWAEWIAFSLEDAGFKTIIQAWDFPAGSNFVLEMQEAAAKAERTVLVLSPDYLNSKMAASEWAAAFAQDPEGQDRRIVPVMVRECQPKGLLPNIVQIRIHNLGEDEARKALLQGVDRKRAKPSEPPKFPGSAQASHGDKEFPGSAAGSSIQRKPAIPKLKTKPTELDLRRFAKDGFATIRNVFRERLEQAKEEDARFDTDFTDNTATDFRAEIFVDGKSKSDCRIFLGEMFGPNSICYGQGHTTGNSANEILSPVEGEELAFSAMMAMGVSDFERSHDIKKMSPEVAADYFWAMFIRPLSYR